MSDLKKVKCANWCSDCKAFDWSYCEGKVPSEQLNEAITEQTKPTKEERFWQIFTSINRIEVDKEKYPHYTFGFKDKEILFEYNSKNKQLWLSYNLIWQVFIFEYSMSDEQIEVFIKGMVEEHFNCVGIKPSCAPHSITILVEAHFNFK